MFNDELNLVKKEFSQRSMPLPFSQPWYAGRATWARALKRRIDTPMKVCMCVCDRKAGDMYVYGVSDEQAKCAYNLNCDDIYYNVL